MSYMMLLLTKLQQKLFVQSEIVLGWTT